jgi:hypothetical protein
MYIRASTDIEISKNIDWNSVKCVNNIHMYVLVLCTRPISYYPHIHIHTLLLMMTYAIWTAAVVRKQEDSSQKMMQKSIPYESYYISLTKLPIPYDTDELIEPSG